MWKVWKVYEGTINWSASTGEEEALSPETLARISELEQALASNPYNYANHEELVKLLKGSEEFDRLKKPQMCVSEKLVGKLKLKQRVCIRKAHFV